MTRLEPAPRSDRPAGDEPEEPQPGPARRAPAVVHQGPRQLGPAHVATLIVFAGSLWLATTPVNDIDTYWHVAVGREIVARHTLAGLGRQWLGVDAPAWSTSQWLSEVLMYGAVDHAGWVALPALRLLATVGLFAVLWLTLVRRRQPILAFVVVLTSVVGLQVLLQDRPATVSLLFIGLLAAACERLWVSGRRPPLAALAAGSVLWAQVHGLWVLAPAAFALVAVGGLLERRRPVPGQVRTALLCAAASSAGVLNPQGPISFVLPWRFHDAGVGVIGEWAATSFTMSLSIAWGILIGLLILAWARTGSQVRWTEVLWVTVWTLFGLAAIRNVGPALLMTGPVALRALERWAGGRLERFLRVPAPRERRLLALTTCAVTLAALAGVAAQLARMDPLQRTPALAIARRLAATPGTLRVWDAYNASGCLVAFGGGRDGHLLLVVDGRSDLWGGTYISDVGGVSNLSGDWEGRLRRFRPDALVVPTNAALVGVLEREQGWTAVTYDGDYVLLAPRGSPLS